MKEIKFNLEKDINTIPAGSSLICNIEFHPAIVYDKLKSLFGEPTIETINLEEQYYYCLSVQMESGKKIYIYVYSGGSGPAIGGLADTDSKMAAQTLIEMIQNGKLISIEIFGEFVVEVNGITFTSDDDFEEMERKILVNLCRMI
uniref:hypothetical protein n=1 Tax=Agathobacter sp. TaxID=2021311 RepID=UPI004055BEBC